MNNRYRVESDYECAYPDPLRATRGTKLKLHKRDAEWPGWVWCTVDGQEGWVPQSWLDVDDGASGTLLRDYIAKEVTVRAGEYVTASMTESGWAWVTTGDGESGWVPLNHLVAV